MGAVVTGVLACVCDQGKQLLCLFTAAQAIPAVGRWLSCSRLGQQHASPCLTTPPGPGTRLRPRRGGGILVRDSCCIQHFIPLLFPPRACTS